MRLADFDFDLPAGLIAQTPAVPRDAARLLHVQAAGLADHRVRDLPGLLRAGDVLVLNDTKVIPARLFAPLGAGQVEILLHQPLDVLGRWRAFARPARKLRTGQRLDFAPGFSAEVREREPDGQVQLDFALPPPALFAQLHQVGQMPLPPYIKRPRGATTEDAARYQTVYAAREGAVAAPTAGLHFTDELFTALAARGIGREMVTLHVGAGTFQPVKVEDIREHRMHGEWGVISPEVAARLRAAKAQGRRVVAVGTTSLRLLESAARGGGIAAFHGETDIFITPGFRFQAADALLTNFHLPRSTLFMLVAAFAGLERMRAAYAHAIEQQYRFYSYGDASLLERADA